MGCEKEEEDVDADAAETPVEIDETEEDVTEDMSPPMLLEVVICSDPEDTAPLKVAF